MNNSAEQTALGPMVIVAAEQHEPSPLVHDPWAQRLLPLSGRIAAGITLWSTARRTLIATTEKKLRGGWASFLCRKRYIDDQLVNAVVKGLDAVVILGAGYDTRAYRLPELVGIPICEVDLPSNIARKAVALRRCFGRVPPGVTLLAGDFETDNLAERLDHEGLNAGARTFYVWEAVTQYRPSRPCGKRWSIWPTRHPAAVWRSRLSARIFWTGRRCTAPSPPTWTSW